MKKKVLDILQQELCNLTSAQRKVADYILKNPVEASFLTLDQLASVAEVSTTTVMRLSFNLGYSGYSEFQKELQELLRNRVSPTVRLEANIKAVGNDSLLIECAEKQIRNIRATVDFLSGDVTNICLESILKARKVYIVGVRTSFGAAYYLYQGLNQILDNCEILEPGSGDQVERILDISSSDLVIAISLPRYGRATVDLVTAIKNLRGAKIISITDGYTSPLASISDLVLPCAFSSLAFHNSITGAVIISDFLITSVAMREAKKTKQRLASCEEVFTALNFHVEK